MNTNDYNQVPEELKAETRFLVWRFLDGKKPPVGQDGRPLNDWNQTESWLTFDEACARKGDGIGFMLGDGWGGLDLDSVLDQAGNLDPKAAQILAAFPQAYVERSPSNEGVKLFGRSDAPGFLEWNAKSGAVDIKTSGYFTITGKVFNGSGQGLPLLNYKGLAAALGARPAEPGTRKPRFDPSGAPVLPGRQETVLFKQACALRQSGMTEEEISAALMVMLDAGRFPAETGKAPFTKQDCAAKARSACRFTAEAQTLQKNKENKVIGNQENLRRVVEFKGIKLRRNDFSDERTMSGPDSTEKVLTDDAVNQLRFQIDREYAVLFGKDFFFDGLHDLADANRFHPVRDYLNGLKWDGTPRIEHLWVNYFGAQADCKVGDDSYTSATARCWMVGAVRRVRHPGCKHDEMPILESVQGWDKSSGIRALCPDPRWFSESLAIGSDAKRTLEDTTGVWLAEIAELHTTRQAAATDIKNFLSRQTDGPARMAYAREPVSRDRQFVVIGSTNLKNYLEDTTGNRRFWPIKAGPANVDAIKRDRDQLWAEAAYMEATGGDGANRLPRALWSRAAEHQEARVEIDVWFEELSERFGAERGRVTTKQCRDTLNLTLRDMTKGEGRRLGSIMRRLGFELRNVKIGSKVAKCWDRRGTENWTGPWLLGDPGDEPQGRMTFR